MSALRIGEILVAEGVLTEAAVNRALGFQRVSGERIKLGTILLNWDLLAEDGLLRALARHYHVTAAPWSILSVAPIEVTRLIPTAMAIRFGAFPYAATKTSVQVAFLDPSNLTVQDEIASVANRRVAPAVALEIRLLEAHQKFYGRHIPLEYRAIVQKIARRTTRTNVPDWQKTIDFRAPDLVEAERKADELMPSAGPRTPPTDLGRAPIEHRFTPPSGTRIPIRHGLTDRDLVRDDTPTIEIPDMPMPAPPPHAAPPAPPAPDAFSDTRPTGTVKSSDRMSDTHPVKPASPEPDDTLSKRMGRPFASLSHGEKPPPPHEVVERIEFLPDKPQDRRSVRRATSSRGADGDDTLPRGAAAHLAPRDLVADMWRPAPGEESGDESGGRLWSPSASEIEASMGEARTRDEISQVAVETLLVSVPRVLLLGCGKTAITGWQGRGVDVTPESVAAIRIPLSESNVFSAVRASGVPHFGPLEWVQWPKALADSLGEKAPDCAVFPIRILDGIAAFLYADRLGEPMHYEDFAVIARAAAATANSLARFLLRRNNPAPVV